MESQKQLPFQKRDEFDQELYLRNISANGRAFLQAMYRAANGTIDAGVQGAIIRGTQFQMIAEQTVIADLIGIPSHLQKDSRTRAVRRTVEELEGLGILARVTFDDEVDGKNVQGLYYLLDVIRLIDLPVVDLKTTKGRAMAHAMAQDPFEEIPAQSTLSGGLSGGLSGPVSGGLSAPHDHVHEQDMNKNPVHDHDHEQGDFVSLNWGKRGTPNALGDDDVARIVARRDRAAFLQIDQEGLGQFQPNGLWKNTDLCRMQRAATWHHAFQAMKAGKVKSAAAVIRGRMRDGDVSRLTLADEDWAKELLKPPRQPSAAVTPPSEYDKPQGLAIDAAGQTFRQRYENRDGNS